MALLRPGWWATTWWSDGYWHDRWWPAYGVLITPPLGGDYVFDGGFGKTENLLEAGTDYHYDTGFGKKG